MGIFDNLFGRRKSNKDENNLPESSNLKTVSYNSNTIASMENYTFPEDTIMTFDGEVLDVNSSENIAKFKHNLKILMAQAKQKGKIDNFYLIREDDLFPTNWEWNVSSDQTTLEPIVTELSFQIRKTYALEQAGLTLHSQVGGFAIPGIEPTDEEQREALSKVDKRLAAILMPSHFRSTKHFTVNTPLGVTGDYNAVSTDRNFIVFDKIDNFLASGYGYSVAGHDAYLDVTHEPLKISNQGFVMIADEKYDELMKNPEIAEELSKRKVIRFKGDETIAIDMVLAAHGALPTQVGLRYAEYDQELRDIYENSFKALAEENGLAYDQSHAGADGHFSDYYDEMNTDHHQTLNRVVEFLKNKFPENAELFTNLSINNRARAQDIIQKIGTQNLLTAINEYNEIARRELEQKFETYSKERASITADERDTFVSTVRTIDTFYQTPEASSRHDIETVIQKFFQGKSKEEQLEAAGQVLTMLSATVAVLPQVDRHALIEARSVEEREKTSNKDVAKPQNMEHGE